MSLSSQIAPELPYLRRFSRALSGTQASGDAYVVATLESLIEDPAAFPKGVATRVALYRVFCKLWSSLEINLHGRDTGPMGKTPEKNLAKLTPRSREAFLLRTVEGFTVEEVAVILDIDTKGVETLIDQAAHEIAEQVATDVLIIEDEPIIALDLESIVQELGHRVVGIARTRKEAVTLVAKHKPALVLADIQLADGSSGLDAVNDILTSIEVTVIFITAYPERFLTGDRPEPAFLLTKPFEPETIKAAVSQALFFDRRAQIRAERTA